MVMRNNVDCAMTGCSAAQMSGFRLAAPEYLIIYILFIMSVVKHLKYIRRIFISSSDTWTRSADADIRSLIFLQKVFLWL